jgi:neutral ceramidase
MWKLLALVAVCSAVVQAAGLRAAAARVEITPAAPQQLWGFENRTKLSTGTVDPLYARVLVLEAGAKRLGLVALDLGRPFGAASLDVLRSAARREDISCLLVAASHTHSAPIVQDVYRDGAPAWERTALERISGALHEAAAKLADARIGTGYGTAYIGHNRLKVNDDGTVSWFEINQTHIPTAPVDPTVSVLRIDGVDGRPIAILVNYSCHPVVFGSDNLQYSADFPAVTTRVIDAAFPGAPVAFFLQGAPGDINPYYAVTPLPQDPVARRDWTGRVLGEEAVRVARRIHTEPEPNASINFVEETLPMHIRWDIEGFRAGLKRFLGDSYEQYAGQITPDLHLPVTTVLINRRIALMTMPGEPFVNFQMNWRQRCPVPDAFFLGYTNAYFGYFPTIRAATLGGYGAGSASTWVEVGAGERMVDRAVIHAYEMLGRLYDDPEEMRRKPGPQR